MNKYTIWNVAIVATAAIAVLGGAQLLRSRAPDLRRLYASGMEPAQVPPVIIVPGILGSRLRERSSGRELWPGTIYNLLFCTVIGTRYRPEDPGATCG